MAPLARHLPKGGLSGSNERKQKTKKEEVWVGEWTELYTIKFTSQVLSNTLVSVFSSTEKEGGVLVGCYRHESWFFRKKKKQELLKIVVVVVLDTGEN